MKHLIGLFFLIPFFAIAQNIDSSSVKSQQNGMTMVSNRNSQIYQIENRTRVYIKPKFFDFIVKVPKNFVGSAKEFVAGDNPYYLTAAALSSIAIIPFDQKITDGARQFSESIGLSENNKYYKLGGVFNIPTNVGAGLYLVGNGSTSILLAMGFGTYGLIHKDFRAQATASGIMESLIQSGLFCQTIKRISGRESPFIARENGNPGGRWRPFPSFKEYGKHTPKYDAFPSGHLTTIMSALTVITENYPEVKWVKPVGYSMIGLMCFQMVQSEVHWVSDYPIAIFMGYLIGKTIAKNSYEETEKTTLQKKYKINFTASRNSGINNIGMKVTF